MVDLLAKYREFILRSKMMFFFISKTLYVTYIYIYDSLYSALRTNRIL